MAAKRETRGAPNSRFGKIALVSETGSTNSDMARLAADGAPDGSVLVAERQTSGRGRHGRSWFSAEGSALAMSWLMRPKSDPQRWGLIPLITGIATVEAVQGLGVAAAALKWPNDVLVGERKLAGILCESQLGADSCVVIGLGMNLSWGQPPPREVEQIATTLDEHLQGVPDRLDVARTVLGGFEQLWQDFERDDGLERLLERYSTHCLTLRQPEISFHSVAGSVISGRPTRIDRTGALLLQTSDGEVAMTAGDVRHRPA